MKKTILFLSLLTVAAIVNGQNADGQPKPSSAFQTAMLANIRQLDTVSSQPGMMMLANNFERIGNAEKTKWEPFYYASYCYTAMAYLSPDKSKIDWLADKAEALLQQAEAIDNNNSEINCLFAMLNSCRILVDPVSRFQIKGREVNDFLEKARQQDENNPRIYLLQARMQLRTPEAFGGGKELAKRSAETAIEKFKTFVPATAIAPAWGEAQAKGLLSAINAQ